MGKANNSCPPLLCVAVHENSDSLVPTTVQRELHSSRELVAELQEQNSQFKQKGMSTPGELVNDDLSTWSRLRCDSCVWITSKSVADIVST